MPVEGGHDGGRFSVEYKGKKKMFETHSNSDQLFHLAAFYGNCRHLMEAITRGWKIALTFSLVWTNAKTDTPHDIPNFLTALNEVEEALSPWIPHQRSQFSVEKDAMEIEEPATPTDKQKAQISQKIDTDSSRDSEEEESDCSDDYDCLDGDQEALFFVLKEKYKVEDLTFSRLRGKDRNLAKLFQNCHFLDVHLAMVIHESTNKKQNGSRQDEITTRISRWVDSSNTMKKLSLKWDWQKQRVGPIRKLLTSSGVEHDREKIICDEESDKEDEGDSDFDEEDNTEENSEEDDERSEEENSEEAEENKEEEEAENNEEEDENVEVQVEDEEAVFRKRKEKLMEGRNLLRRFLSEERAKQKEENTRTCTRYFYHFVLVIWPKHQSFRMYCRYGIHSLLDGMENALSSSSSIQAEKNRHEITGDLKKMISFCCAEPQRAWSEENLQDKGKGDLTLRLLRLCIALRAREEGLALLNILGSNFGSNGVDCTAESFEGIQNEYVARAIADFECEVVGKSFLFVYMLNF